MSDVAASRTAAPRTVPVMTHRMILFVIFGLMAGMFLSALDQTIVGTAIRTIGDDLHGLSQQAWVTTAYLITSTISTPIYGKLSDIFGRRPLFIFAIVVFIIGSLIGGLFAGADEILGIAGWRWVFLINVPIGLVALGIVLRFLHIPKHPRHSVRIDWFGAAFVIMALVPLLLVAEQGRTWGWGSPI